MKFSKYHDLISPTATPTLVMTGTSGDDTLTGDSGDDSIDGLAGDDSISGLGGNDSLYGSEGNDALGGGDGADSLYGGVGNDTLVGGNGADSIYGEAGDDILQGNSGSDYLDGGDGNDILNPGKDNSIDSIDSMEGGLGNDQYVVFSTNDIVSEATNEGGLHPEDDSYNNEDLVQSYIDYSLPENIEKLTLLGDTATHGVGNGLANTLSSAKADSTCTLEGGAGNDKYFVKAGDTIIEKPNEGTDTISSNTSVSLILVTQAGYAIAENVENVSLTGSADSSAIGSAEANTIDGNDGDNTLDGGGGADTLRGGLGDDSYSIDDANDVVIEIADQGTDTAVSGLVSYTLKDNFENLTLAGSDDLNGTGNSANNQINGNSGDNILDGGVGADTLVGGDGDDWYLLDSASDVVTELSDGGYDSIETALASFSLAIAGFENIEYLQTDSSANANLTGNALSNEIIGGSGSDLLSGLDGGDFIFGSGAGNDTFIGGLGADTLVGSATTTAGLNVDTFVFDSKNSNYLSADKVSGFSSGHDKLAFNAGAWNIGDHDSVVDGYLTAAAKSGGFSHANEVVTISTQLQGDVSGAHGAALAASAIGSAASAYSAGDTCLFVVHNYADSAIYYFQSSGNDAKVSASELTLIATLTGVATVSAGDFIFQP